MILFTKSSGIGSCFYIALSRDLPSAVVTSISFQTIVLTWTNLYFSARYSAYVLLPEPGGPVNIIQGALQGAI